MKRTTLLISKTTIIQISIVVAIGVLAGAMEATCMEDMLIVTGCTALSSLSVSVF